MLVKRKACCQVANAFLSRLELIWLISRLKISKINKMSKNVFCSFFFLAKSSRSQWGNVVNFRSNQGCEQAHLWVTHTSGKEWVGQWSCLAGWSLLKRCQESEPALISVIFLFLLSLSEVKYHLPKAGKTSKLSIYDVWWGTIRSPQNR